MKKITFSVIAISLVMGLSSSCKPTPEGERQTYQMLVAARDSVWNQKQRLEQQAKIIKEQAKIIKEQAMLIKLFDNYYHSNEELLDFLHIDPDTDLETDAGAQYLEDRYQLNKKFNQLESNPNHRH